MLNNEGMNNIDGRKRGFYLQGLPQITQEDFCEHILENNFCETYGNPVIIESDSGKKLMAIAWPLWKRQMEAVDCGMEVEAIVETVRRAAEQQDKQKMEDKS